MASDNREPKTNTGEMKMSHIELLNKICEGWTQSREGGLLCNPAIGGGIIDSNIVSGEWFIIFNDSREMIFGLESREDAVEAFASAR